MVTDLRDMVFLLAFLEKRTKLAKRTMEKRTKMPKNIMEKRTKLKKTL